MRYLELQEIVRLKRQTVHTDKDVKQQELLLIIIVHKKDVTAMLESNLKVSNESKHMLGLA